MTDIGLRQEELHGVGDQSWIADWDRTRPGKNGTLDGDLFPASVFVDGVLPSGLVLGKRADSPLLGPYNGQQAQNEVQTVTLTGATTGDFTLTFDGQTTAAIAYNALASAVQAALEALSNVSAGDVTAAGDAGGPYTVTFGGSLAQTDVATLTADATGLGGGTVAVTTTTVGGALGNVAGLDTAFGHLFNQVRVRPGSRIAVAVIWTGAVDVARLPANSGYDTDVAADLPHIEYRA